MTKSEFFTQLETILAQNQVEDMYHILSSYHSKYADLTSKGKSSSEIVDILGTPNQIVDEILSKDSSNNTRDKQQFQDSILSDLFSKNEGITRFDIEKKIDMKLVFIVIAAIFAITIIPNFIIDVIQLTSMNLSILGTLSIIFGLVRGALLVIVALLIYYYLKNKDEH